MKKNYSKKTKRKHRATSRGSFFPILIIFSVGIALLLVVAAAALQIISSRSYCANSRSCKESFAYKVENDAVGIFNNRKVSPPKISSSETKPILGASTPSAKKHIVVDLAKQKLFAYDGDELYMETYIASGLWGRTPTGEFKIWEKVRSTRMTGGQGDDFYDLPNVPFVMFIENEEVSRSRGFSFHGAYWHNNFGHAMSHGCINMRAIDAEKLYNWAGPATTGNVTVADKDNEGTTVTILGEAP